MNAPSRPLGLPGNGVIQRQEYIPEWQADTGKNGSARARRGWRAQMAATAGAMRSEDTRIDYLSSLFVPEDETCFYSFTADSIDVVAAAAERAELREVRIVEAVLASRRPESRKAEG